MSNFGRFLLGSLDFSASSTCSSPSEGEQLTCICIAGYSYKYLSRHNTNKFRVCMIRLLKYFLIAFSNYS